MKPKEAAVEAARAADDSKARDVVVLDVQDVTLVADFFVICHGGSSIQVQAIAENIEEHLSGFNMESDHKEGQEGARWILLDYGALIVHVFHEQDRDYYDLEGLWGDAEKVQLALSR